MKATIVDAGLDYLTATVTPKHSQFHEFDRCAMAWLADAESVGFEVKDATSKGYVGWRLEGAFYGKRDDSRIWEANGAISQDVARELQEKRLCPKITRADFQVTHDVGTIQENWAAIKLKASEERAAALGHSTGQTVGHFKTRGHDTGITLGRRGSNAYYRTYLAGVKHPDRYAQTAVRDEVELRSERAMQMFYEFQAARNKTSCVMAVVRGRMERLHLAEEWFEGAEIAEFPPIRYNASEERTLLWLINHVCPVIERVASGPNRARLMAALRNATEQELNVVRQSRTLEAG